MPISPDKSLDAPSSSEEKIEDPKLAIENGEGSEKILVARAPQVVGDVDKDTKDLIEKNSFRFVGGDLSDITNFKTISEDFENKIKNEGKLYLKNVDVIDSVSVTTDPNREPSHTSGVAPSLADPTASESISGESIREDINLAPTPSALHAIDQAEAIADDPIINPFTVPTSEQKAEAQTAEVDAKVSPEETTEESQSEPKSSVSSGAYRSTSAGEWASTDTKAPESNESSTSEQGQEKSTSQEKKKVPRILPTPTGTWYERLGVSEDATPDDIKAAHRKKAKDYSPDARQHLNEDVSPEVMSDEAGWINNAFDEGVKFAAKRKPGAGTNTSGTGGQTSGAGGSTQNKAPGTTGSSTQTEGGQEDGQDDSSTEEREEDENENEPTDDSEDDPEGDPEPEPADPQTDPNNPEPTPTPDAPPSPNQPGFIRDPRIPRKTQLEMLPETGSLLERLKNKALKFFVDKIWGVPARAVMEFAEDDTAKVLKDVEAVKRMVTAPGRKIGMLLRSAQISRQQSGWIIKSGSLDDLLSRHQSFKETERAQKEAIAQLDAEIIKMGEEELRGEPWAKAQKNSFIIERDKLKKQLDKTTAKARTVRTKYNASHDKMSQFESRRSTLANEVLNKVEKNLGPFETQIAELKSQEAAVAKTIEGINEKIEAQNRVLNEISARAEANPYSRKAFRGQEKIARQLISKAQDALEKVNTQDYHIKRRIQRIEERSKPWTDMKEKFTAQKNQKSNLERLEE